MIAPGGGPASGCKLNSYIRNTTTRSPLYSDVGLATPTTNPYVGDADGRLSFYFNDAIEYEWVVTTSDGATTLWEAEVVGGVLTVTYSNGILIDGSWATPLATDLGARWAAHLGKSLPQFYLDDYYETTWEAALNAADGAAFAAGGGIIYATGREEYAFTGYPDAIAAGNYIVGIPNYTRFKMPVAGAVQALLDWRGSTGSSYTLSGNAASGAETISLSSVTGLAVGDILRIQKTPGAPITLGKYTQLVRIEEINSLVVTLSEPLEFAVATSDTYTIVEIIPNVGGGCSGIIFDGSVNTSDTWCLGAYALYCSGMYFDNLGGENMSGAEPMDGNTIAGVLNMFGCFDTRGLNDFWAYKSGSGAINAFQFREMGPTNYGSFYLERSTGFGAGWYDSTQQHVQSVIESGSLGRAGKMQCVLGFKIDQVRSAKPRFTGFAVTEGARGWIGSATYHPTDLEYFTVTSIVRSGNVATITFAEPLNTYDSGHPFVIAGATGANDFNGTVTLVRVGSSGNAYTYANAGVNETAGGTILCNLQRSPSFWVNDTGCNVVVDHLDFRGVTNSPTGDVHTGSNDSVRIGVMRTEGSFTPTFAGTAGASAQGTGRHIAEVNGVSAMPNGLTIAAGGLTMTGQLTVTHTGAVPARFTGDDFQYVTALSSAATSGSSGFAVTVKDSGGTNRTFTFQNAAGTARLINGHNTPTEIWMNGSQTGRFNSAGGMRFGSHDFVTAQGGLVLRSFTSADIAAVANAVNTTGKVAGLMVYDTTNNRIMIASGSAAASAWYVADASASVTPS
jgi:hypothetical protein